MSKHNNKLPTSQKMYSDLLRAQNAQIKNSLLQIQKSEKPKRKGLPQKRSQVPRDSITLAPSAVGRQIINRSPKFAQRSFRFTNREFVCPLYNPAGFNWTLIKRLRLNPGSEVAFPWLSGIAQSFEFYKFHSLRFVTVPKVPTSTTGDIIMAIDYDAADGPPTTEQQMTSMDGATESNIWLPIEQKAKAQSMSALYKKHVIMSDTRFENTNQDEKTIDCGQLHIAVECGNSLGTTLQKLWVEYDIELMIPQPRTENPQNAGGTAIDKVSGLSINAGGTAQLLTDAVIGTVTGDVDAGPLYGVLPAVQFVASNHTNLLKMLKPFSGIVTTELEGTGTLGAAVPFINDINYTTLPGNVAINSILNATKFVRQDYMNLKEGDLLGWGNGVGTTISSFNANFGSTMNELMGALPIIV